MASNKKESKKLRISNKSDKPDHIVLQEHKLIQRCLNIERSLPYFMDDFFLYLKGAVAITTRLAYLEDIQFFCQYLIDETDLTRAERIRDITVAEFSQIMARDVNSFIGDYCQRYEIHENDRVRIVENHSRSLARKKSSLSVMFKNLYRDQVIPNNITDGFNPIQLPKPQPDAIKRLDIDEVVQLLKMVEDGAQLSKTEMKYWQKTRLRDRAILIMFLTYGLRVNELQQLDISSFNFKRGEFKIYRKRGKETLMPINRTCEKVIKEYIEKERPSSESISAEHQSALFLSLQKKRMTIRAIRNLVKKYTALVMGTAAEDGYSPHKLRATAATSLIQQDVSIFDVQNLMDHDNVSTTQLYAAHRKDVKREVIKKFEWFDENQLNE